MDASDFKHLAESLREPGFWEMLRDLVIGSRRPLDCLQIEISTRCPGRCVYCPHTVMADRWQDGDMSAKTFHRLWPLMRRSRRVHLQGWGEPLRHPAFFDMVAIARKAGCAVSTTTCGLDVAEQADALVQSGLDIIAISLAGTENHSNAARRGIGFRHVCDAIERLQEVRHARQGVHLEVHFAYLMLASQMTAVRELPVLMKRLGVHAAVVSTLDYLPAPELWSEAFELDQTEKLAQARQLLEQTTQAAERLGVDFAWSLPDPAADGKGCRENIQRSLFVSADGFVSPCVFTHLPITGADPDRQVFGSIIERDPLDIWNSSDFKGFREALASGQPRPRCRNCLKRYETDDVGSHHRRSI